MKKTVFWDFHRKLGARLVDFAGYRMPLQYTGITDEHLKCRNSCAIFDTSHMSILKVKGEEAVRDLNGIIAADTAKIKEGRCRYSFMLNEDGGIIDDLVVYPLSVKEYMIVGNAASKERDIAWLKEHLGNTEVLDCGGEVAKIDLQGPFSGDVIEKTFGIPVNCMPFYSFASYKIEGENTLVSRSGYTGEKGYEIYAGKDKALPIWEKLIADERVSPAGLGARDTLRMEAGLLLYGQDIDEKTTPVEAGIERFVDYRHSFIGAAALKNSAPAKKIVFLVSESRKSPRPGWEIFNIENKKVGIVTSGTFSPCLKKGIGIGYISSGERVIDNLLIAKKDLSECRCTKVSKKRLVKLVREQAE